MECGWLRGKDSEGKTLKEGSHPSTLNQKIQ